MLTQILINSILSALLLSLVAIGFNMIFNATKVFHLAHGALYVGAIYSVYGFNNIFITLFPKDISITLSWIFSLLLLSIVIIGIELLVYRPLYRKNVNPTISLISSLGVYLFIINIITLIFGNESIALDNNYRIVFLNHYFKLTNIELFQFIISTILIFSVILFTKSKFYLHIRAITDDTIVAQEKGIPVQTTRIIAMIAGTLLVGIAGIMKGYETAIEPNVGLTVVLTASVAVIIGGINSIKGTIFSCFVIALIENFSVTILSAQWKDVLTYSLLIAVLLFYQKGLISVKQRIETR
jgi:branched-chain amino acid transport system permease protein